MIRVDRSRVNEPPDLNKKDQIGLTETDKALAFYAKVTNQNKSFVYKAYSQECVKDALNELFHGKCAYCESKYIATAPVDVEHYRPKAGVSIGKILCKPGYYWLAASWCNLLPSCIDCNRSRGHHLPNGKILAAGKACQFPLADESKRAIKPGQEAIEQPLLLNPCTDDPNKHLEFYIEPSTKEVVVRALVQADGKESEIGKESIRVYGLNRPGLVMERTEYALLILDQIERVRKLLPRNNIGELKTELKTLKSFTDPKRRYTAMANFLIEQLLTPK